MSVKIVTDSSCDLPDELVQELGITRDFPRRQTGLFPFTSLVN